MADQSDALRVRQSTQLAATTTMLLVLTSVHHAYGSFAFQTPWRLHIIAIAAPLTLAIWGAHWLFSRAADGTKRKVLLLLLAAATILFPIGMIGFYEGGFNHVLKNLVFFAFGTDVTLSLFPPPTYELPTDLLFELTGIAQFPVAIVATIRAINLFRLARDRNN